ncbi:MAG: hypothetical protein CV082_04505 [Candidatus Brocadia sp. BL1]|nr:MAG: hypothetical protein CV082_04505 [Candidatus Brocadia sp. BL1]
MNAPGCKSSEQTIRAGQLRTIDGILFVEYLKSKKRHRDFLADFFISVSDLKQSRQPMHSCRKAVSGLPGTFRNLLLRANIALNQSREQNGWVKDLRKSLRRQGDSIKILVIIPELRYSSL